MSFVDEKKFMASDNPNFFKIGDAALFVPVSNIEISRHENYQSVSYLRDSHAMKIHTGRSTLRVNISFPILVDQQLPQLQALVAMTRVTPFVPIQNRFLQAQIKLYDEAPESFELNKTPDRKSLAKIEKTLSGDAYTSEGEPTFLEALPMAIMGMSVTMGGDSPEVAECAMSFVYWNPLPWFGIDLQYWKDDALGGLVQAYSRYISSKIVDRSPSSFDTTVFRWWDINLWSELREKFAKEIAEAEKAAKGKRPAKIAEIEKAVEAEEDGEVNFDDFNNYLKFKSTRTGLDELLEGIAEVESGSAGQNAGWTAENKNTHAAGRYQMTPGTFRGLFFGGNDTVDGVPLKDKALEALAGSSAASDHGLRKMIERNTPNETIVGDRSKFADWYARPEMAALQTFVSREYLRGLLKQHDGDAVSASLEYFMGDTDARPYINHWKAHGTVKDWSKKDKDVLGAVNHSNPLQYLHTVFGTMSTSAGYSADSSAPVIDPITFERGGSGSVPRNRKGDVLGAGIKPIISSAAHNKLLELGWRQISRKADGSPSSYIIDPLFARTEANIIDLEAGGITDAENQVVTSITIAFQNKFASLPVQGWPYPALQHMGSIDSELRMTIACLSDSQQYNRIKQTQHMLHTMSSRARKYHSDVHDAREILKLSQLGCSNKLINSLGINDVVMTDLQVQVDPEATNMIRAEVIMSESAFDPNKEKLTATLGKNDRRFRIGLREEWLAKEKYLHSSNASVVNMGARLRALQKQNDSALSANKDILFETGQLERVVADAFLNDDDFRKMAVITREDKAELRKKQSEIEELTDISVVSSKDVSRVEASVTHGLRVRPDVVVSRGLRMQSAMYIAPTARVLNTMEAHPVSEFEQQYTVIVPINPDLLLTESLGDKIGSWMESLYKSNKTIPGDPLDIDRIHGSVSQFLSTSFGVDMVFVWQRMKHQPTVDEFNDAIGEFFLLWTKAFHEWYNRNILEAMLVNLYRRNEGDSTFNELVARSRDIPGAGIYKDLMLDRMPTVNPYEWLDNSIEPKILSAMEDVVRATEKNSAVLIKEYNTMMRDRGEHAIFRPSSVTSNAVAQDSTSSSKQDKEDGERRHRSGIAAALDSLSTDVAGASLSLREFSAVPFTMRRAFPAYRMYFIEEDNQGLIKRFDDFYNYNAITDIQMVKYKNRPTTMIITMTNLFGHLDAKTFSDMADKEEIGDAIRANASGGTLPSQPTESGGVEKTIEADGTEGPLREIMLKPGTKIVLKLGYDNNPDNLPTCFAGQITEVSGGSVMTIVCQDWMSEMFAGLQSGTDVDSSGGAFNLVKHMLNTSSTRDLQNTSSARSILGSIMRSKSLTHFGHWQLDKTKRDPNYFGYRRESSLVEKPFDNVFSEFLTMFSGKQLEGTTRSHINIHPQHQPFYSAFGTDTTSTLPTMEDWHSLSFWEIIEIQRRLMPNHLALVRPYGQGDATLYFGPPWGVYVAAAFDGETDKTLSDNILSKHNKEVFRSMIKHNATMTVNGLRRMNESMEERFLRDRIAKLGFASNDSVEVPISIVLNLFGDVLFSEADQSRMTNAMAGAATGLYRTRWGSQVQGAVMGAIAGALAPTNVNGVEDLERNNYAILHSGSPDSMIDKWYDLLFDTNGKGGLHDDEDEHSVLINIQSRVRKVQLAMAYIRSRDDEAFDPDGVIRKMLKPVRQWHIVTAKHHIIANNIQLNNNFANEIKAGSKNAVRYDAELTERRTRFADREIPEWANKEPDRSIFMSSLLAEEVRTMYRGQLVLTGNSEIEPHDIIVIFDETRHMHGAIEVAKVNHIFNQEMGFITIVEPHLIVEQGDYSLSTALASFISALASDVQENNETSAGAATNLAIGGGALYAGRTMRLLLGGLTTRLIGAYVISQMLVPADARNHPLTIFPLIKRDAPWIAGLEGASGRGVVGIIAGKVITTLKSVTKLITTLSSRTDDVKEAAGVIPNALNMGDESNEDSKVGGFN